MMLYEVYANDTLIETLEDQITAEEYRGLCQVNGWEFAPCDEDDYIEVVPVWVD